MSNKTTTAGKTASNTLETFTDAVSYIVQIAPKTRHNDAQFLARNNVTEWATQARLFDAVEDAKAAALAYREENQMESAQYPRILRIRLECVVIADKGVAV